MTKRITNAFKDQVVNKATKEKIEPRVEKLKQEVILIAQETADNVYPKETSDWMKKAPADAFQIKGVIYLGLSDGNNFHHQLISANKNLPGESSISLPKPIQVLACHQYKQTFRVSEKNKKRLLQIQKELNQILRDKKELSNTLRAAMSSCTTIAKLRKEYPSIEEYLPEISNDSLLPVVTDFAVSETLRKVG